MTRSLKEYRAALASDIEQAHGVKPSCSTSDDLASTPDGLRRAPWPVKSSSSSPTSRRSECYCKQPGLLALQDSSAPTPDVVAEPRDKPDARRGD